MLCPQCQASFSPARAFVLSVAPASCKSCGAGVEIAGYVQLLLVAVIAFAGAFKPWQSFPLLQSYPAGVGYSACLLLAIGLAGGASVFGAVQVSKRPNITGSAFALVFLLLTIIATSLAALALLGYVT